MNLYGLSSIANLNRGRIGNGGGGGGGQRLNALAYGPIVGEHTRATTYGPTGNRLTARDVAVSPGLLGRYPLGSKVDARDAAGNLVGLGTYNVGDKSYRFGESQPTRNTIEFRDANRSGQQVYVSPSGFRPIPPSGDVYGNYGSDISGEPQVITSQNIPPNDYVSPSPTNTFYPNLTEFGGGPNAPTYGSTGDAAPLTPFDPMGYAANPPPNEDVSPTLVNTFLSNYNPNVGTPARRYPIPGVGGTPSMNWTTNAQNNPAYPIPGLGGFPSTYGGGQSWQSNASRIGQGTGGFWGALGAGFHGLGGLVGGRGGAFSGGTSVSNIPSYSGFGAPVGRGAAGPLAP